jgi:hypothetical protein
MRNSIILLVLFVIASIAHVDMSKYDLLMYIFYFGVISLLANIGKKDKTFLYICVTILGSICYAIGKEFYGLGTTVLNSDIYVRVAVWVILLILLIIRFKENAKQR